MLNKFSKFLLFCLAYLPLIISLTIKSFFSLYIIVGIFIFSLIVILLVRQIIKTIKTIVPSQEKIRIIEFKNSEFLTFIFTYLLPFFGFDTDIRTLISFLIIFFIIGYIYVDTSLFCINPLLKIFFGYNIYEISIGNKRGYLLSKSKLSYKEYSLKIRRLEYNIYMEGE